MSRPIGRSSMQRKHSNHYRSYNDCDYNDYAFSKFYDDNNFASGNLQSIKISPVDESSDVSIKLSLGPEDFARCSLTKALQVAEPVLKKLIVCITECKTSSETLKGYALKYIRMPLIKKFTKEQISILQENQDFDKLDITLTIRWIEVFIDFNRKLIDNTYLKDRIRNTLKRIKKVRNDLCHNRELYSQIECQNLSEDIKAILGELHEILHNWDLGMDISSEKKKTDASIDTIMKENISKEDFKYMCLQKVLNHIVEPALNSVVKLICYKKEGENFLVFFKNNGKTSKDIKNAFYKEEKIALESKSRNVQYDVILCSKIIEISKEWHAKLTNDYLGKKELSNIINDTRDLRNHIAHNILSMSQDECNCKAYMLGNTLEDLVNFLRKKKMFNKFSEPVIDIQQIFSDIESIMNLTYPYS